MRRGWKIFSWVVHGCFAGATPLEGASRGCRGLFSLSVSLQNLYLKVTSCQIRAISEVHLSKSTKPPLWVANVLYGELSLDYVCVYAALLPFLLYAYLSLDSLISITQLLTIFLSKAKDAKEIPAFSKDKE